MTDEAIEERVRKAITHRWHGGDGRGRGQSRGCPGCKADEALDTLLTELKLQEETIDAMGKSHTEKHRELKRLRTVEAAAKETANTLDRIAEGKAGEGNHQAARIAVYKLRNALSQENEEVMP